MGTNKRFLITSLFIISIMNNQAISRGVKRSSNNDDDDTNFKAKKYCSDIIETDLSNRINELISKLKKEGKCIEFSDSDTEYEEDFTSEYEFVDTSTILSTQSELTGIYYGLNDSMNDAEEFSEMNQ